MSAINEAKFALLVSFLCFIPFRLKFILFGAKFEDCQPSHFICFSGFKNKTVHYFKIVSLAQKSQSNP